MAKRFKAREPPQMLTQDKLQKASGKLKARRTPGSDGIPPKIAKIAMVQHLEAILKVFNRIYQSGEFPEPWQIAKLVLLEKSGKDTQEPGSSRPLCLMDSKGKTLEHVIYTSA